MRKIILKVNNLGKKFEIDENNEKEILKDINLEIHEGEFVTIMGPSGSGKSTLLYSISGMDKFNSGEVIFNNRKISELDEEELSDLRLKKMGFVFQQAHFLKNLNIYENIILPGYSNKNKKKKDIEKQANYLVKKTCIKDIIGKEITKVSGGQLQRAGICRALINSPDILFGDEPTGALNSKATNEILDLLNEINMQGTTILLVTHNIKVASRSKRVLYINDGKIIDERRYTDEPMSKKDMKVREEDLTKWLIDLGF